MAWPFLGCWSEKAKWPEPPSASASGDERDCTDHELSRRSKEERGRRQRSEEERPKTPATPDFLEQFTYSDHLAAHIPTTSALALLVRVGRSPRTALRSRESPVAKGAQGVCCSRLRRPAFMLNARVRSRALGVGAREMLGALGTEHVPACRTVYHKCAEPTVQVSSDTPWATGHESCAYRAILHPEIRRLPSCTSCPSRVYLCLHCVRKREMR